MNAAQLAQLTEAELPEIKYVVKDLLTPGCVLIAAKPKVGKSGAMAELAICVASGHRFLEHFDTVPGEVVMIAFEDEAPTLRKRITKQCELMGIRVPDKLEIMFGFPKAQEGGNQKLEEIIEDYAGDLKLVIIDDLRHFNPMRRSYNHDNDLIEHIDRIGLKYGVCVAVVNHQGKGRVGNNINWDWMDRIQGSGTGAARIIIGLEREDGHQDGVLRVTGKAVPNQAIPLLYEGDSGFWRAQTTESDAQLTTKQAEVYAAVQKWPGRKAHELARLLKWDFEALRQLLRFMAGKGLVSAVERRYYATPSQVMPWVTEPEQIDLHIVPVDGRVVAMALPAADRVIGEVPMLARDEAQEEWIRRHGGVA